jgi:Ca-activated chloride channel family protein
MSQYHYEPIWLLVALAAVPYWLWARHAAGRVLFSSLRLLPTRGESWRTRLDWLPDVFGALAIVAMAVALTRPYAVDESSRVRKDGIAIMMVLDHSSSMAALDLSRGDKEQTRLDAVKDVFERFVLGKGDLRGRPDDAIGLVSFAGYPYTRSPLTLDHGNLIAAARALELATPGSIDDGTAIGDGLAVAVERLADSPARSKVAILLTDGEQTKGERTPEEAAVLARDAGVKVYTIGAGTTGVAPVRDVDPDTGTSQLRPIRVSIDEPTLKSVAAMAGGQYFRADDAAALDAIYAEIDRLERTELEDEYYDTREHFDLFVAAGLILAVIGLVLRATVFRRLP